MSEKELHEYFDADVNALAVANGMTKDECYVKYLVPFYSPNKADILFPFGHYDGGEEACQEDDGGAEHDGEVGMQMQTRETP